MSATNPVSQLESSSWSTRKKGMQTVISQGDLDTALEYALKDDTLAVIDVAAEALFPEPTELLLQILTAVKGPDATLAVRYHLPNGNYLYAEEEVCGVFRKRGNRITPHAIEGLGRAYMRGIAPVLAKVLDEPIMNLAVAKAAAIPNATSGVVRPVGIDDKHIWSGPTTRALCAAIALRRLDYEFDPAAIERMLGAVEDSMADCPEKRRTRIALQWVIRDLRGEDFTDLLDLESAVGLTILADVAVSYLKRSEGHRISPLVNRFGDVYFWQAGFCFWPLFDYIESEELSDISSVRDARGYRRAREMKLNPPPWWSWSATQTEPNNDVRRRYE